MPRKRKLSDLSDRCRLCLARDACMSQLFTDWIRPKLEDLEKCSSIQVEPTAIAPTSLGTSLTQGHYSLTPFLLFPFRSLLGYVELRLAGFLRSSYPTVISRGPVSPRHWPSPYPRPLLPKLSLLIALIAPNSPSPSNCIPSCLLFQLTLVHCLPRLINIM
jgi:hypothetical protein